VTHPCEWDPVNGCEASQNSGCPNPAEYSLGRGKYLLCGSCAGLPEFARFRNRDPITPQKLPDPPPAPPPVEPKARRKPISKSVRFEVFKRDSFTCQYCGAVAPEVVLHVDHLTPVSKGGDNDLMNLVTSCAGCNHGKSDRKLDDNSAVQKQRRQLEQLAERREQLEMMLKWRDGLKELDNFEADSVSEALNKMTGFTLNPKGKAHVKKLIAKYDLGKVLRALDIACDRYVEWVDGHATKESIEIAYQKLGGVLAIENQDEDIKQLYYTRGILKRRLYRIDEEACIRMLKEAHEAGVPVDELKAIAKHVKNWQHLNSCMYRVMHGEPWK